MPSSFAAIGAAHVPYMQLLPDEEYSAVVEHARLVLDCVPPGSVLSHVTARSGVFRAEDPDRILGFADLLWRVRAPDGTVHLLVGEYQGEAFHSSADQRGRDDARARAFADEGWPVEEMWKADLATGAARVQTVLRFASRLGLPRSALTLSAVGPRFFASHVIEEASQRSMAAGERRPNGIRGAAVGAGGTECSLDGRGRGGHGTGGAECSLDRRWGVRIGVTDELGGALGGGGVCCANLACMAGLLLLPQPR